MRIALATYRNLPDWEIDDQPLRDALAARGVEVAEPAWDDVTFDWASCDACLIRTTWDYQERQREFVDWAERVSACIPLFNPVEIVRWNTDKTYLRDLESAGVAVIPTIWIEPGSDAAGMSVGELVAQRRWSKAFLKPAIGSTARETLRFALDAQGIAAADAHLNRMVNEQRETMLLQPYLETVEVRGEFSAIFIDGECTHGVRKIPVPGDYRVQDDFGATDEPFDPPGSLIDAGRQAIEVAQARCGSIALSPSPSKGEGRDEGETCEHHNAPPLLYARCDYLLDERNEYRLTELELVEPSLFFRHGRHAAQALADALVARLS